MRFRLLACDLDGTLLHRGKVTGRAIRALQAAHNSGCRVAICTGRAYAMMPRRLRTLPAIDAFINSNGAAVSVRFSRIGTKIIHCAPMDANTAIAALKEMLRRGGAVNAFFDGKALFDIEFGAVAAKAEEGVKRKPLEVPAWIFFLITKLRSAGAIIRRIERPGVSVEKVGGIFADKAEAEAVLNTLGHLGMGLEALTTTGNDLEVTAAGATKGNGLAVLAGYFGVPREEILVCGDSGNDISMRGSCGFFAAPETASADVLAVADVVTEPAEKDGVANWLLSVFSPAAAEPQSDYRSLSGRGRK
jgi:Cof subfamily protein (haloacid dehalogenase superfamily)